MRIFCILNLIKLKFGYNLIMVKFRKRKNKLVLNEFHQKIHKKKRHNTIKKVIRDKERLVKKLEEKGEVVREELREEIAQLKKEY